MKKNKTFNESQYGAMRTAFLAAFPKIFTDIDYSGEIFSCIKESALKHGFSFSPELFNNQMAVEIEARHKALNLELKKHLTKNTLVIEIAAGLSPRHLQFPNVDYIEMDFEPILDVKREVYEKLKANSKNSLVPVDLSNKESFSKALKSVVTKKQYSKIIIINEGLFWYLTKDEILQMTNVIKSAMSTQNWVWITTDCPAEKKNEDSYRKVISDSAKAKRGTFCGYTDFTEFFKQLNLTNERFNLSHYVKPKNLSSAKLFSISEENTIKRINSYTNIAVLKETRRS